MDLSQAVELRERLREFVERPPSYNDLLVKAAALVLREFPRVNGAYRDGEFEHYERVNVGIAVAAEDALVVPTIFDADQRSLTDIAQTTRTLAAKVRDGSITPAELSGGALKQWLCVDIHRQLEVRDGGPDLGAAPGDRPTRPTGLLDRRLALQRLRIDRDRRGCAGTLHDRSNIPGVLRCRRPPTARGTPRPRARPGRRAAAAGAW